MQDVSWAGPLNESPPHVQQALAALLECPEACKPFVIVEQVLAPAAGEAGVFVQFAGSTEQGLLLDVPALGIVGRPIRRTPRYGARIVLEKLAEQGVPTGAVVRIRFESTQEGPPS